MPSSCSPFSLSSFGLLLLAGWRLAILLIWKHDDCAHTCPIAQGGEVAQGRIALIVEELFVAFWHKRDVGLRLLWEERAELLGDDDALASVVTLVEERVCDHLFCGTRFLVWLSSADCTRIGLNGASFKRLCAEPRRWAMPSKR